MFEKIDRLQRHARMCRDLADSAITAEARKVLLALALDYENEVTTLQTGDANSLAPFGKTNEGRRSTAHDLS
jgi:hypothetical protein